MRKLTLVLLLAGITGIAQTKGNGIIETLEIPLKNLRQVEMNLYANVTINGGASAENMSITGDSNLLSLIDAEVVDGVMKLAQTEWIQPSKDIEIRINAPHLNRLQVGVHETVLLNNLNRENLNLMAILGKIVAQGTVEKLSVGAESGMVDAGMLKSERASINIWGDGEAILNTREISESTLSEDARLEWVQKPERMNGDVEKMEKKSSNRKFREAEYITIKIENNSWNRNHFEVKGPKKDGGYFGYGFPMMPGAVKKERWTVGTKVYKKNKLGMRKLLVEIKAQDEGKTIKLFQK
ncbi:MAG: DUF2807 domain-containing protein [Bacteroidota bacterium]